MAMGLALYRSDGSTILDTQLTFTRLVQSIVVTTVVGTVTVNVPGFDHTKPGHTSRISVVLGSAWHYTHKRGYGVAGSGDIKVISGVAGRSVLLQVFMS